MISPDVIGVRDVYVLSYETYCDTGRCQKSENQFVVVVDLLQHTLRHATS